MHDSEQLEQQPFGVVNDYTNVFHARKNTTVLNELLSEAEANHVPVVSINVANLLATLVSIHQPRCILELGTAYGVSTYHIAKAIRNPAKIITVDLVSERQEIARKFLSKAELPAHDIEFFCADFRDEGFFDNLNKTCSPIDFIFIDAAKGQYQHLLDLLTPMLSERGVIVFDNVFLNGWIINDKYPNHRQKTAFVRMKQFLENIKHNTEFEATLIPFDDGVLVLAKK